MIVFVDFHVLEELEFLLRSLSVLLVGIDSRLLFTRSEQFGKITGKIDILIFKSLYK